MGRTAGLSRYPGEVFAQVKAQGTFYPPNGKDIAYCHLSRSWDVLHPALATFGCPLSHALSGEYGYEGGLDAFQRGESNPPDHYLAFVSPQLVKEIATRLRGMRYEQVEERIDGPSPGRDREYVAPFFQNMVDFYEAAAAAGDCIFVQVA